MSDIIQGFKPVFDAESVVLVLGSFPSVKSRQVDFYYGNKQNRFWKMLCGYFGAKVPEGTEEKIRFLKENKIALWDVVASCEIEGSSDNKIRNYTAADVRKILNVCPIRAVLLNGAVAYRIFCENFSGLGVSAFRMPSTSPANARYSEQKWREALDFVFKQKE